MTIYDLMGGDSFEERTIDRLLSYDSDELHEIFDCSDDGDYIHFWEKENPENYVKVFKSPGKSSELVVAKFKGFQNMESSNHYLLLQNVGYNLALAFGCVIGWKPEIKE